jgi:septum formation protein
MKVILASSSPRRVDLLSQARIQVSIIPPHCDETAKRGEPPHKLVTRLAQEKAEAVLTNLRPFKSNLVIIAADTIVVAPNGKQILGKPDSPEHAYKMLRSIAGKTHQVFTGYCLLGVSSSKKLTKHLRTVRSKVTLRPLSPKMIREYIQTGEPLDKAGSDAAQGCGMNWISSIQGSYTNVVGLPMCELLQDLESQFGVIPQPPRLRDRDK